MPQIIIPNKILSVTGGPNAVQVSAVPCFLRKLSVFNINAAARFVKLYNLASGTIVGTSIPLQTEAAPGNTALAGATIQLPPDGIFFSNGLAIAITGGMADNDTTAVNANEVVVNYATSP